MANFTFSEGVPPVGTGMIADQWNLIKAEPNQILTRTGAFAITAAQLHTLRSNPVLLLPIPAVTHIVGANSPLKNVSYVLQSMSVKLNYVAPVHVTTGAEVGLFYGVPAAGSEPIIEVPLTIFTQSANHVTLGLVPDVDGYDTEPTYTEGVGIYLGNTGSADLSAGNSSLSMSLSYLIIQL